MPRDNQQDNCHQEGRNKPDTPLDGRGQLGQLFEHKYRRLISGNNVPDRICLGVLTGELNWRDYSTDLFDSDSLCKIS